MPIFCWYSESREISTGSQLVDLGGLRSQLFHLVVGALLHFRLDIGESAIGGIEGPLELSETLLETDT